MLMSVNGCDNKHRQVNVYFCPYTTLLLVAGKRFARAHEFASLDFANVLQSDVTLLVFYKITIKNNSH